MVEGTTKRSVGLEWRKAFSAILAADRMLTLAVMLLVGTAVAYAVLPGPIRSYALFGLVVGMLPSLLGGLPGKLVVPMTAAPQTLSTRIADFLTARRYVIAEGGSTGSSWRHNVPRLCRWADDEVTIVRAPEAISVRGPIWLMWTLSNKLA